jgi:hypothetical protein
VPRQRVGAVSVTISMPTGFSPASAMRVSELKISNVTHPVENPVSPVKTEYPRIAQISAGRRP